LVLLLQNDSLLVVHHPSSPLVAFDHRFHSFLSFIAFIFHLSYITFIHHRFVSSLLPIALAHRSHSSFTSIAHCPTIAHRSPSITFILLRAHLEEAKVVQNCLCCCCFRLLLFGGVLLL